MKHYNHRIKDLSFDTGDVVLKEESASSSFVFEKAECNCDVLICIS